MTRAARVLANSVRGMTRNRVRTFFMMLGTFVGVCALTVMMAIGRGTQQDMMEKVGRMLGGSSVYLRAGGSRMVGGAHTGGPTTTLTLEDVRAIDDDLEQVELADPMFSSGRREVVYGSMTRPIRIEGHSEAAELVSNRSVTRGAYFTRSDVVSASRVALVGEVVVRELFAGRDPIGEQIRIGTIPFQVVGVLEPIGIDPHGIDKDSEIIIPITTMMRRLLNVDYIMAAHLALTRGSDVGATVLEIEAILRKRHALG
ncbi:MAG: ABC transporter permease, partial [Longimicrobiales bacterium]